MRPRAEIKDRAKAGFSACYWPCVLTALLVPLFVSVTGAVSAGICVILFAGPMTAGLNWMFIQVFQGRGAGLTVGEPFTKGFENFGRNLGGYWWMRLFTFLWCLLFFIPGIIKSYSYAMTMYILADCPNVRATDALKLSMRIMNGHKWELFVFELSFIGWGILNLFTFGLLAVFYVNPYMYTSLAGFYLEAREDALNRGVITLAQLEGLAAV